MKNPVLFLFTTFFILGLLIQPGCKTADDSSDQYTLAVTVGTGVTGTPITGTHSYEENQIVSYSYTLQTGYVNLVVTLDGITIANSGSITMNSNHTLNATASEPAEEYTLTVLVGTGVTGIPVTGTYTYEENEIVSYSYTLETGYENLEVMLDGITIADSGVITMNSNHTLKAISDDIFNIIGGWHGRLYGGMEEQFWVTFSEGNYCVGILEIHGTGEWDYSTYELYGDHIYIHLEDGSFRDIEFVGTIENNDRMSGTWSSAFYGTSGTWWLERD